MFRNLAIVRYAAVLVLFTATSVSAAEFGTAEEAKAKSIPGDSLLHAANPCCADD